MKNNVIFSLIFCLLIPGYAFASDVFNGSWKGTYSAYYWGQGCEYSVDISINQPTINVKEQRTSCTSWACARCPINLTFTNKITIKENRARFSMDKEQSDTFVDVLLNNNTMHGEGKTRSHGYSVQYKFNAKRVSGVMKKY